MKYIDNAEEVKKTIAKTEVSMYDTSGLPTKIAKRSVCRSQKITRLNGDEQLSFFINTLNGTLYDPHGVDSTKRISMMFKEKSVDTKTFENYLKYLRSRNNLYMTRAQRSFINA
jgi:hypothetical protein